jgi:hypothetical protein
MTPFEYGAYVTWKLYPSVKVSFDSRYEAAYPMSWAGEAFRFYAAAPGWQRTLSGFPSDVVMVRRAQPLAMAMRTTSWQRIYRDGSYELYARPGLDLPAVDFGERLFRAAFP